MIEKANRRIWGLLVLAAYTIYISYIAYHHELWRDEVDVWLFVRDTDFNGFFRYLRNSGHPGLWHLFVLPFAKLQFPNFTFQILHLFLAFSSAYLLLFYSPFPIWIQFSILFSYFFIFEYSVIARNYAIGILFLFSICAFFEKRFEKPFIYAFLILLLANTNLYCSILASGFALMFIWEVLEKRDFTIRNISSIAIMGLGGILLILQVFPSSETQGSAMREFKVFNNLGSVISILYSFTPGISKLDFRILTGFILLITLGILVFTNKKLFFFYLYSLSLLWSFYTFIFINGYRHGGFVFLTFLVTLWIYASEKKETSFSSTNKYFNLRNILLFFSVISLSQSIPFGWKETRKDIRYSFSNAKEMASFIKQNDLDKVENIFSVENADKAKTILFYLQNQKQFYFPVIKSFGSHMLWNKVMVDGEIRPSYSHLDHTIEKFRNQNNIYFISSNPIQDEHLNLLYQTKDRNEFIADENFFL
ncbi:MAG TPA: hypothetical protein PKL30_13430, partial [Leptospiraceae bacterium]|nr:hypothetical protein [Leptospiraceae bacterium]